MENESQTYVVPVPDKREIFIILESSSENTDTSSIFPVTEYILRQFEEVYCHMTKVRVWQ